MTNHFEKTILLLNTAGYLELGDYARKFSAIVFMGLPGQDAGAVADVLTGSVAIMEKPCVFIGFRNQFSVAQYIGRYAL